LCNCREIRQQDFKKLHASLSLSAAAELLRNPQGGTMNLANSLEKTYNDLLFADIDLAMTFLKIAETTQPGESAQRNYANACRAYGDVVAKLQAVTLSDEEQALFDEKLSLLRSRLRDDRKLA